MIPTATPAAAAKTPAPAGRVFLQNMAAVLVFNVFCAIVVTYTMRIGSNFAVNLVYSMCIGLLAQLSIDGTRLLLWGPGAPPKLPFFLLLAIATPAAYFIGSHLAGRLTGASAEHFSGDATRHTASLLTFTLLASLIGSYMFWNRGKVKELEARAESEKARAAAIEKQALQAQLQLLQAQVEPHMLFNTLANLQGLIALDPAQAQRMLDQLIQYLRATLSSARSERTTLAREFSLMQAYLGLMAIRMGSRLAYRLDLPERLAAREVPPMLLQPLVENAIKHGLEPKIDGGAITVTAGEAGGLLTLTIADTGLGMDAPCATAGTGVGLANVRERLQALYGERAGLRLDPNPPGGVIARLTLPLES